MWSFYNMTVLNVYVLLLCYVVTYKSNNANGEIVSSKSSDIFLSYKAMYLSCISGSSWLGMLQIKSK